VITAPELQGSKGNLAVFRQKLKRLKENKAKLQERLSVIDYKLKSKLNIDREQSLGSQIA
jgi:hypothetical protein